MAHFAAAPTHQTPPPSGQHAGQHAGQQPRRGPTEFDLQARPAWPTTFFFRRWADHAAENPGIIDECYRMKAGFKENIASKVAVAAKSAMGLIESPLDLFELTTHPGLKKLGAWILDSVRVAVSHVNGNQIPPSQLDTTFTDSWFHITNNGGYHDAHYHSGCSWCGIYYIRAGNVTGTSPGGSAGNGVNRFYAPLITGGLLTDYGNAYLENNRVDITPTDGLMILFPAYCLHSALAYRGETDRLVIAFNTKTMPKPAPHTPAAPR